MSERETDFEFDFFEESETQEGSGRGDRTLRRPLGARGSRGPRGPRGPIRPRAGFTPLLRLLGLLAFAILIVVLLLLWVQSCQEDAKRDAYGEYMTDIAAVGRDSERVGRELNDVLTTPAIKPADLQKQLAGLVQQQQLGADRARRLEPPGPLRVAHEEALEALDFRVSGLAGLAEAFRRTQGSSDAAAAGALLASQAERLAASDVVWDDLFKDPAVSVLQQEEISGVEVPDSNFVQTPDLASTSSMVPIWERINGSAASGGGGTPTGLHGNGIESVSVIPGDQELSTSTENTVEATVDLAFAVAVANTGDHQEVKVEVTLTIQQSPTPIVKKQTIDIINPGETKRVVFRDFPSVDFGERRVLRVDVDPVPGEENTGNNSYEYPVIFSLGS
ncbi:MAG TPA: CARDB domain-containing protein [Gaiellaceae bacterium]|nr:CARDB domain-containing protein [Gaiellaceae bacterium]